MNKALIRAHAPLFHLLFVISKTSGFCVFGELQSLRIQSFKTSEGEYIPSLTWFQNTLVAVLIFASFISTIFFTNTICAQTLSLVDILRMIYCKNGWLHREKFLRRISILYHLLSIKHILSFYFKHHFYFSNDC